MFRRFALALLSIAALILTFRSTESVGFSVTSENGTELVSAGTSPTALAAAFVLIIAWVVALEPEGDGPSRHVAGTGRRFIAWFLDFCIAFTAVTSIVALLPLAAEAFATGHFAWSFERDAATAGDWALGLACMAFVFGALAFYWAIPACRGGQTVGQAVLGLRVVPSTEQPLQFSKCFVRGLLQPFAPILWFTRFASPTRSYFHDDFAKVRVMTVGGPRAA